MKIEFRSETLQAFRNENDKVPDTLYHYTSLEALRKILSRKKMWATHISFLNDSKETTVIQQPFVEAVLALRDSYEPGTPQEEVLMHFNVMRTLQALASNYVISFTTEYDDLSQFRAYNRGDTGICLGFDSKLLQILPFDSGMPDPKNQGNNIIFEPSLFKCKYVAPTDRKIVKELLEHLKLILKSDSLAGNSQSIARQLVAYLECVRPMIKDS